MKKIVTLLFLLTSFYSNAEIWEVEVKGTSTVTPSYAPQFLTIQTGDEVKWIFLSGLHNVTSSSGPEPFASTDKVGNSNGSVTYSFTFNIPGFYEYNCTLSDHATTQFGTITVEGTIGIAKTDARPFMDFTVWPNPANSAITLEKNHTYSSDIRVLDLTGKVMLSENNVTDLRRQYDVSHFPAGIYFVELTMNNHVQRKRLVVR